MEPSNTCTERRANQRDRLLARLEISSPDLVLIREVIEVAGFQYGARILELRRLGHQIENDPGQGFRLISKAATERIKSKNPICAKPSSETSATLFGDLAPEPRYPD